MSELSKKIDEATLANLKKQRKFLDRITGGDLQALISEEFGELIETYQQLRKMKKNVGGDTIDKKSQQG